MRSGGQDFGYLKLKDAFLQQVVVGQMDIDMQDYRPVVVYFNGNYHGIYNIREKTDPTYVERHLGIEESESGNLTLWAKEGVLLLNSILSVEKDKPASHKNLDFFLWVN